MMDAQTVHVPWGHCDAWKPLWYRTPFRSMGQLRQAVGITGDAPRWARAWRECLQL